MSRSRGTRSRSGHQESRGSYWPLYRRLLNHNRPWSIRWYIRCHGSLGSGTMSRTGSRTVSWTWAKRTNSIRRLPSSSFPSASFGPGVNIFTFPFVFVVLDGSCVVLVVLEVEFVLRQHGQVSCQHLNSEKHINLM